MRVQGRPPGSRFPGDPNSGIQGIIYQELRQDDTGSILGCEDIADAEAKRRAAKTRSVAG